MTTLQERIAASLKKAGMKPIDLARLAGVSRATVSLWVNGPTKTIEGDNLTRAARALNVDAHWLSTGENKQIEKPLHVGETAAGYNNEEMKLLQRYRSLNDNDKSRIMAILDILSKPQQDKKSTQPKGYSG